jgi:hypothetical protein
MTLRVVAHEIGADRFAQETPRSGTPNAQSVGGCHLERTVGSVEFSLGTLWL